MIASGGATRGALASSHRVHRTLFALVLATWCVAMLVGMLAAPSFEVSPRVLGVIDWGRMPEIATRNGLAALALYTGAVTFGITTPPLILLTGLYIGAVIGGTIADIGVLGAMATFALWLPFEIAGLMLASYAGLLPAASLITSLRRRSDRATPLITRLTEPLARSVPPLLLALLCIAIGAVIEVLGGLPA